MMKKTMLVVGLMLVCGTVFAQRSLWNRVFGKSPTLTPPVQQQDLIPPTTPVEFEQLKNQVDFMASACGEGYFYPSVPKSVPWYSKAEWECNSYKQCHEEGKYCSWPEGENITSYYVCGRGYPVPANPCPDGFELMGDPVNGVTKVGWPTEAYGCVSLMEPTPEAGITQGPPPCPTAQFSNGNFSYLYPKNKDEWDAPDFKECFKKESASAWKEWRGGKDTKSTLPMSQDNKAVKQCAKSGVRYSFWCHANYPKNPEASPCTAKGVKSLKNDIPVNHGACCFFTQ